MKPASHPHLISIVLSMVVWPNLASTPMVQAQSQNNGNSSALTVEQLRQRILEAKQSQPNSPQQFLAMQSTIRDASQQLLKSVDDRDSAAYKEAEFDYLSSSVMLLGHDGKEAALQTFAKIRDYLDGKEKLTLHDAQIAILACQNLEHMADTKVAKEAYTALSKILEDKKEPQFSEILDHLQASQRRLDLPGLELKLDGTTLDGKPFQLSDYRGSITVLYLWATWSKPSTQEFSHLQRLQKALRSKGLQVITLSLDEQLPPLEDFIKNNNVSWPVLWDRTKGKSHPFVKEHGIASLPTSIVLDREGKVISVEASVSTLAIALDRIFFPSSASQQNAETDKAKQP